LNNRPASVLIVDDEVDACQNLADIFTDLGYRVDMAYNGTTALEKLQHARYDIALLDLMMPGMDGASLCSEMKRRRPEMVAVLVTAYPNHPRAEASRKAGVWRIALKPVYVPHLITLVDEAVNLSLVLLVDDDVDLCAVWNLLWERGFRVRTAHDTPTVADLLGAVGFGAVLIDMRLPEGGQAEALRTAPPADSLARTVLITGYRAELAISLEISKEERSNALCFKPFDIPELLAIVERLSRP
jgi:two-component system, NtrC family, response regulator HydG